MAYTPRASKEELERWYFAEKKSPEVIAKMFGVHGRTVRGWMEAHGIKRLGATHLVTSRKAPWNAKPRPPHVIEAARRVNTGRPSPSRGKGSVTFSCEACGTLVTDKPYRRKRTCSKSCRDQLNHLLRGEKHWNYNDGGISNTQRQRLWAQCLEWRQIVIKRDGKCAACGSPRKLRAHHLDSWAKHPEKRFDPTNGITMCHDHHWQFHRETSHKAATKEMFEEWIKRWKLPPSSTDSQPRTDR